jgi:hypothetical protein
MEDQSKQFLEEIRGTLKPEVELLATNVLPTWTGLRFSLRALLIAMTLIAFLLSVVGVVVTQANRAPSSTTPTTAPAPPPHPNFPTEIKQF